jgi:hypothetical protein
MEKLLGMCQHQSEEVVENALGCLREIMVQEYEAMAPYFDQLCLVTSTLA